MKKLLLFSFLVTGLQISWAQSAKEYFVQGQTAYRSGNYSDAISSLDQAIQLAPEQPAFWNLRAAAKAADNQHIEAIADYDQALKLKPDNPNYIYNRGVSLERIGRLTQARYAFDKALELKPDMWTAVSSLGNLSLEYEDYRSAVKYFEQAQTLNSQAYNPPNNLAYAFNQLGQYQKAITRAEEAIAINEKGASAFNHLGYAYLQLNDHQLASTAISQSIKLDPNYSKAYYSRGLLKEKQEQYDEAIADYEKALGLTPAYQAFFQFPYQAKQRLEKQMNAGLAPEISISSPANLKSRGFLAGENVIEITEGIVRVQGKVSSVNIIKAFTINSSPVLLDPEGYFDHAVSIDQPNMEVKVKAVDTYDQSTEVSFRVRKAPGVATTGDGEMNVVGKSYALIIGMADYDHPQLTDLAKPVIDAQLLQQTLLQHYNFPQQNVRLLENPTRERLFQILEALSVLINENDNLLIFYAGHGHWDDKFQNGYWLLRDATPYNRSTWFSNNSLKDFIRGIASKHTLLITDACFSGSIFITHGVGANNQLVSNQYEVKSRNAMTSGALQTVPDESAFLKYLVMRLRNNNQRYLGAEDLFGSMRQAVMLDSHNVPQFGTIQGTGSEGGDFIFIAK